VEAIAVSLLFLASGGAALIYEVLWLKQLGLLFGNTAQAAAATLAVFFLGLSAGARAWGERAARSANPLRGYALLEIAIPVSALLYFGLLDLYHSLYPALAEGLRDAPRAFAVAKLLLAAAMLLPPAFFMGGTLPYMSQHMVRRREDLGATFSWLYACNTAGGAAGAFCAAFFLPPLLGFTRAYGVAMSLNLGVAALAWVMSRSDARTIAPAPATPRVASADATPRFSAALLSAVACFSGAATLGLEVLWTRMFAQVLHNSVYSFTTILVTFLIALAIGAAAANRLSRMQLPSTTTLPWLLVLAGAGAGVSPHLFHWVTGGLHYVAPAAAWSAYIIAIFATAGTVLLLPGVCMGMVFPYLLRGAGLAGTDSPGATVGRMAAWNTVGSIAGSLACGFVLIEWLGLWASIRAVAFAYLGLAVLLLPAGASRLRVALIAAMAAVLIVFDAARLPIVTLQRGELLRQKWETGQAIVAVIQSNQDRVIKIDNYYSLGGTSSRTYEEAQADIPLIVHPHPRHVFFLGLGSGITAGTALRHGVERVTVAEIVPAVVTAARLHFEPYTNGLFDDPRVRIVVEDGRQHLLTTAERYDVIVSDLFIPWQPGTGSLYSGEHFRLARSRLRPGGAFVQWLPMYQLTQRDAFGIMRTLLEEFPQVTLWRGDFTPDQPLLALIGQEAGSQLDPEAVTENFRRRRKSPDLTRRLAMAFTGLFYVGNLTANRDLFSGAAINTDDLPLTEYLAPIAQREEAGGGARWFTSFQLVAFEHDLLERLLPGSDPYLARLDRDEHDFVLAGLDLVKTVLHTNARQPEEAKRHADAFARHIPAEVYSVFKKDVEGSAPAADRGDS
jgi:spermidine synthase